MLGSESLLIHLQGWSQVLTHSHCNVTRVVPCHTWACLGALDALLRPFWVAHWLSHANAMGPPSHCVLLEACYRSGARLAAIPDVWKLHQARGGPALLFRMLAFEYTGFCRFWGNVHDFWTRHVLHHCRLLQSSNQLHTCACTSLLGLSGFASCSWAS